MAEEVNSERGTAAAVDIIEEVLARGGSASGRRVEY